LTGFQSFLKDFRATFRFLTWSMIDVSLSDNYMEPGRGDARPWIIGVYEEVESAFPEQILAKPLENGCS